jgi:hypothetical protein
MVVASLGVGTRGIPTRRMRCCHRDGTTVDSGTAELPDALTPLRAVRS